MDVIEKLEAADEIIDAVYRPADDSIFVTHSDIESGGHEFADIEVDLIRQGKITPSVMHDNQVVYDVAITLDEQSSNTCTSFTFTA
jgi:hypothetical protein